MCANKKCPIRKSCERSADSGTIPHPKWQSFSSWTPVFVGIDDHDDPSVVEGHVCRGYIKPKTIT